MSSECQCRFPSPQGAPAAVIRVAGSNRRMAFLGSRYCWLLRLQGIILGGSGHSHGANNPITAIVNRETNLRTWGTSMALDKPRWYHQQTKYKQPTRIVWLVVMRMRHPRYQHRKAQSDDVSVLGSHSYSSKDSQIAIDWCWVVAKTHNHHLLTINPKINSWPSITTRYWWCLECCNSKTNWWCMTWQVYFLVVNVLIEVASWNLVGVSFH